jgi:hypothetical protein
MIIKYGEFGEIEKAGNSSVGTPIPHYRSESDMFSI